MLITDFRFGMSAHRGGWGVKENRAPGAEQRAVAIALRSVAVRAPARRDAGLLARRAIDRKNEKRATPADLPAGGREGNT